MKIQYSRNFKKQYHKLPPQLQAKVEAKIRLFISNPHAPLLKNHALSGRLAGQRAFSVTGDVRIIFEEHDNYLLVIMIAVGTHAQVY